MYLNTYCKARVLLVIFEAAQIQLEQCRDRLWQDRDLADALALTEEIGLTRRAI